MCLRIACQSSSGEEKPGRKAGRTEVMEDIDKSNLTALMNVNRWERCSQLGVAMHGLRRKRRQTDRDVLRAVGRGILNPLAFVGNYRLSGVYVETAALMFYPHHALEHDSELIELRPLPRLLPTRRTAHVSHARRCGTAVHTTNIFVDQLRPGAGNLNASG